MMELESGVADENNKPMALVIDDEQSICSSLAGVLSDEGWNAVTALSGREGIKQFIRHQPDLVILDVWMDGMGGIETLQRLKELRKEVPIVIMSGHGNIETAVRAVKLGAFEYLEKPLSLEKLLPMLEHASTLRTQRERNELVHPLHKELIGSSEATIKVKEKIRLVAPKNAWVLITGENGTGKEIVAQLIHLNSARANYPFVAINCAAIPEELIESELFGHEKGSFTNALARKKGKFELANKGTLFLDEIADMSLRTQAKILRILQEQQFERVGGKEGIKVDVRVIAATNKMLEEEIKKGNFREDLFYRLNVVPFHLLPLRERKEDITDLLEHFVREFSADIGERCLKVSEEVKQAFLRYPWPGNVRELRNTIERICIMAAGEEIKFEDLPDGIQKSNPARFEAARSSEAATLREARSEFEKSFILSKLEENEWNVTRTAEAIGIERSNLHRKLKAFGIDTRQLRE